MSKPWAVLIADIHYDLSTLPLADSSMKQAISHASKLQVPLIVAGDLHNSKGAMRGECVAAMLATFATCQTPTYVLPGNHCRINEKDKPHSLEFLRHLVSVVDVPTCMHGLWLVPYESDPAELQKILDGITPGSTLIMHTGVQTAYMGHYTQDRSSLSPSAFSPFRVVSGHYHRRQDIQCGTSTFSYIGSPYTMNFGEASDPTKGFQVLNTDGSLTFVPTNLRKHIVIQCTYTEAMNLDPDYKPSDLVKLKVTGPKSELDKLSRKAIGEALFGHSNFKLDLMPDQATTPELIPSIAPTVAEIMDSLINSSGETDTQKARLHSLWRSLLENQ